MAGNDLLSTIQSEIEDRLASLRPLLAEHEQLAAAIDALDSGRMPGAVPSRTHARAQAPSASSRTSKPPRARASVAGRSAGRSAGQRAERSIARSAGQPAGPSGGRSAERSSGQRAGRGGGQPAGPSAGRGAARGAILAALEHGSHTVAELVTVTAMSAANVRGNVRRLLSEGTISKTEREGKSAYALARAGEQAP